MKAMPLVYSNFAEFENAEREGVHSELDVDQLLDQIFAGELDIEFRGEAVHRPPRVIDVDG